MKSKLEILDEYYRINRQVGHTTAMLNGAKSDPNIIVLVHHQTVKNWIDLPKEQIISIDCLEKLKGRISPILVDHYALQVMFSELKAELLKKDEYIEKQEKFMVEFVKKWHK